MWPKHAIAPTLALPVHGNGTLELLGKGVAFLACLSPFCLFESFPFFLRARGCTLAGIRSVKRQTRATGGTPWLR